MASQLPAFAYCVHDCDVPEQGGCTSTRYLDYTLFARSKQPLDGASVLAKAVMFEWDMANSPPLRQGNKQVYIYVPACLKAIDAAFCVAREIQAAVTAIFKDEKLRGLPCPALPCKIRIDERLNNGGCGTDGVQLRMTQLRDYLKMCERNAHPGQEPESLLQVPYKPGPEAIADFDLPYLDQRCYYAAQGETGNAFEFSTAKIMEVTPRPEMMTGNLIIGQNYAVSNFLAMSSGSEQHRANPEMLFKLTPGAPGAWPVSFFGTYGLLMPSAVQVTEVQQTGKEKSGVFVTTKHKDKKKKTGFESLLDAKNSEELVSTAGKIAKKKLTKFGIKSAADLFS